MGRNPHRSFLRARARARCFALVVLGGGEAATTFGDGGDEHRQAAAAAQHVEPTAAAAEIDRIMYCYAPMSNAPGP